MMINQKVQGLDIQTKNDYYANMPQSARTGYEESKSKFHKERKKPTRARDMPGFPEKAR